MKDFLKWLFIGPIVGLGLYYLSVKDMEVDTNVLEQSVNAEDIFNKSEVFVEDSKEEKTTKRKGCKSRCRRRSFFR